MSAAEPIFNSPGTQRPDRLLPEQTEQRLPSAVAGWAWRMGQTQAEIQELFTSAYQRSREASGAAITEMRERSRRFREERPMALLGIIAGSAFVVGLGAAVWKSKRQS